ncbi:DNA (cytosine-5-)-methyltransferase [Thermincola ferriacetica]
MDKTFSENYEVIFQDEKSFAHHFKVPKASAKKWVPKPNRPDEVNWSFIEYILRVVYGSPRHGNPEDPLDCLIYILLTRKTPIKVGAKIYNKLKKKFPQWSDLLKAKPETVKKILYGGGLEDTKASTIRAILLEIENRLGKISLEKLKRWSNRKCIEFLSSLPGVGKKSALCVMMYTMGRHVFPADAHCIRILKRVGAISFELEHKEAQEVLAKIVPPKLSYSLHVNLIAHGQQICSSKSPKCYICCINKLCKNYRKDQQIKWKNDTNSPTVIDLFSGAGGTSLGLNWAGFKVLAAIDYDFWACQTFALNHPELPSERVLNENMKEEKTRQKLETILEGERPFMVIGGPPCQGFSMIGKRVRGNNGQKRFIDDPRNELYREFIKFIEFLKPKIVVMENVQGLFSLNGGIYRAQIEQDLGKNYETVSMVVNAQNYGVPQQRKRVLFIGALRDHFKSHSRDIVTKIQEKLDRQGKLVTLKQAISDLPPLEQNDGEELVKKPARRGKVSNYASIMKFDYPLLHNHVSRPINVRDQLLYSRLQPGETGYDAVAKYNARHLMVYRNDIFHDKYRRLVYDKPCYTIVAHLSRDGHMYIHPDRKQVRSITVREAARIQSFPDDFIFYGPRTYQFSQVGNAVPPLMSKAIGQAIIEAVKEEGYDI